MTFTEKEIERIDVDSSYEWMEPDYGETEAWVMLNVYEDFKERACDFLRISYVKVCYNGWVDVNAAIDVIDKKVTKIVFDIVPNDDEISEQKELGIFITNDVEMKALYRQFTKTEGFEEFIDECANEIKKKEED